MTKDEHAKYHSSNAFCGYAGQEEMQHLQDLISELTDKELETLTERVGIKFSVDEKNIPRREYEAPREEYEDVIDEADREDFYREYRKIIESRKKKA